MINASRWAHPPGPTYAGSRVRGDELFNGSGHRRTLGAAFCGLSIGIVAGCGDSQQTDPAKAKALTQVAGEVQRDIAKVWPRSADIWPGVALGQGRIILGDPGGARLVGVDGVSSLTSQAVGQRNVTLPDAGSAFVEWDGHPAVVINAADPAYRAEARETHQSLSTVLFKAGTDELFHSMQQNWRISKKLLQVRGTDYPLTVTPRLYRGMVYNDLLDAYRHPQQRDDRLAAAAYWNAKWEKEYPEEASRARTTDAGEGAAGYFDGVAQAVASGAGWGRPAELRRHVSFQPLAGSIDPDRLTIDGESTALGGVAGMLLDETRKRWKTQVAERGQTPLDLLLNGVKPVAEQPSEDLRRSIQAAITRRNSELVLRLNPLIANYDDGSRNLLQIPLNAAIGDLNAAGLYTSHDAPYTMVTRLTGNFELKTGTLRAADASVFVGNVRGQRYIIVPIDPADDHSRVSNGRARLSTATLSGTFEVTGVDENGRRRLIAR